MLVSSNRGAYFCWLGVIMYKFNFQKWGSGPLPKITPMNGRTFYRTDDSSDAQTASNLMIRDKLFALPKGDDVVLTVRYIMLF